MKLSVVMVTHNAAGVIEPALKSISGLSDELLVADSGSTDKTRAIVKAYGGKVFESDKNLGERKGWLIDNANRNWVLVLDSDERVSKELYKEIKKINDKTIHGYRIPYQNYVFGKPVYYGGEKYSKIRLFQKNKGTIDPIPLHEEVRVKGKVGALQGVLHHHSYRSLRQLFFKFTSYACIAAGEKQKNKEHVTFAKLFLYAPHMFWARFIKEQGFRDGWRGFVLAFAFAYMEGLTYAMLLWRKIL